MRAKPSVAQFFYANVLLVALLAARSAAVAKSIPDDVAVDTLNAALAPVLTKRYLKSQADITTIDHATDSEERALPLGLAASLSSVSETIVSKPQMWWWQLRKQTPESLFEQLKLQNDGEKLFKRLNFRNWVTFVEATALKTKEDPIGVMFRILSNGYNDDSKLAKILLAGTKVKGMEGTALKLLDAQIKSWEQSGKFANDVFRWLMLDQTKADKLFGSLIFSKWFNLVKTRFIDNEESANEVILATLSSHYNDAGLAKALLAGTKIKSMESTAAKLLDDQIESWGSRTFLIDIYRWLMLDKIEGADKLFGSLLFSKWVNLVKRRFHFDEESVYQMILATLSSQYKDDATLTKALFAGMKVKSMKDTALELLDFQLKSWNAKSRTADQVLRSLGLYKKDDIQLLSYWLDYVTNYFKASDSEVIKTLKRLYSSNAKVALMLGSVKTSKVKDT